MRKIQFEKGEYYHLYNRGVDSRVIFNTKEDHDRFQACLYVLNDEHSVRPSNVFSAKRGGDAYARNQIEPLVAIGSYCLMPNHFHILATPLVDHGISKFMHKLQTAYSMYFNEKMSRAGRLFQGSYKCQHIDDDEELKYLYAYIHLNPAKLLTPDWKDASAEELRQLGTKIFAYPYSSAGEYRLGKFVITNPTPFPKYFPKSHDLQKHLQIWLRGKQRIQKAQK